MTSFVADTWADGVSGNTPITAAKLANIETGILNNDVSNPASQAAVLLTATYAQIWRPTTAYLAGARVANPTGDDVTAIANHTSGTTYNPANWFLSPTYATAAAAATTAGVRPLNWFENARYGFFSHYTFGGSGLSQTVTPAGSVPADVNALATAFDATHFAADMNAFGVEYVTFTVWHYAMSALYPSTVMNTWLPGHSSTRDVIADLITALKPYGIKLMLYIHLIDGGDLTSGEQTATGWNDATGGYATWNTFINALVTELGTRYAGDVAGYWLDMVQDPTWATKVQPTPLAVSLLAGNPRRVIIGNGGGTDDYPAIPAAGISFRAREYNPRPASINNALAGYSQTVTLATVTGVWWASVANTGGSNLAVPAADMFRFTVLQAGSSKYAGGIAWNAGSYAGSATSIWEPGIEQGFKDVAALMAPLAKAIKGTRPSTSYVTPSTATLNALTGGYVATTSPDARTEYIHVLTAPGGTTLTLPAPADGAVMNFTTARNLATARAVTLVPLTNGGYTLTLDPLDSWSATDTVIVLNRQVLTGTSPVQQWLGPDRWLTNNTAVLQSQGAGSRFPVWSMGPDTATQIQCDLTIPPDWNTFDVDMYWTQLGAGTGNVYMIVNRSQVIPGGLLSAGDENPPDVLAAVPGTQNMLAVTTIFKRATNIRGSINHMRIQRYASVGSDTGPTMGFLGVLLRRTS